MVVSDGVKVGSLKMVDAVFSIVGFLNVVVLDVVYVINCIKDVFNVVDNFPNLFVVFHLKNFNVIFQATKVVVVEVRIVGFVKANLV